VSQSPTDVAALLRSLDLSRADGSPDLSAIEETRSGTGRVSFWNAILADAGAGDGRLCSRPGRAVELYHDAVARHVPSRGIALSVLDSRGRFQHLSFGELDAAATACAAAWSRAGLEPGDVVALALPMGKAWMIAFAAALRLGLVVSCLGSFRGAALCRRLRALAPKRVVFDPDGPGAPEEFAEQALSVEHTSGGHAPPPRAYAPRDPFAKLFSPVRAPLSKPSDVPAETALLWALRDARFAYRLAPGAGLAAPGFSHEQHQPALVLATLLSGARFVELSLAALERSSSLLAQPFITTLGVSPALRDLLRRAPAGPLPGLREFWKSVDEPLDWTAWRDFIEKNGLESLPTSNLLVDAASGGALLVSARRPGFATSFALPSPGVAFTLSDVASRAPGAATSGIFELGVEPDPKSPGWFLLAKRASEYLYGGTLEPRRAGRIFPEDDVLECVSQISVVDGACVVPVATSDPGGPWTFVLVIFTGALAERGVEALRRAVEHALRTQLDADAHPDRVVYFSLHARRDDRKVDLDWCRRQYWAGFLQRKARLPVFQRLTALRAALRMVPDDVR
jgi:hypothetical protein